MSGSIGDNVFRASGVIAAAAAGREGTVDWDTTPKVTGDSPVTAATGSGYFLNTTAGTITINLPAGAAGSIVSMADYAATWQTNNVTVAPNGSEKIGGVAADATLDTEGQSVTFVYVDSTQGWINTMDSTSNVRGAPPYITATGGTISCSGDYKIHTFTGPGTFCVSAAGTPGGSTTLDYMVIAGGGSGGSNGGGGGGAGGFRLSNDTCMSAPLTSPLANATGLTATVAAYAIVVGGGAAGVSTGAPGPVATKGISGSNASFSTITSAGGGGAGGNGTTIPNSNVGIAGGSGGGSGVCNPGASPNGGGGAGNTPPTSPSQGNNGGAGYTPYTPPYGGGGGGGAGAVGSSGAPGVGPGGAGSYVVSTGFAGCNGTPGPVSCAQYFAGGGGSGRCGPGGACAAGCGGDGGGGDGMNGNGGAATAGGCNTGGGGGGQSGFTSNLSGAGGSGIVIIRYKYQ